MSSKVICVFLIEYNIFFFIILAFIFFMNIIILTIKNNSNGAVINYFDKSISSVLPSLRLFTEYSTKDINRSQHYFYFCSL